MPIPNLLNHPSQICKPIPLLRINALRKTRNEFDGPGERLRKWFLTLPLAATSAHKLCQHRPGWRQPASLSSPVLALGLPALSLLQSPTLLTWSLKVSSNSGCHPFNQKKNTHSGFCVRPWEFTGTQDRILLPNWLLSLYHMLPHPPRLSSTTVHQLNKSEICNNPDFHHSLMLNSCSLSQAALPSSPKALRWSHLLPTTGAQSL